MGANDSEALLSRLSKREWQAHACSFVPEAGSSLNGYGHYTESYAKRDGTWRIATSKLTRLLVDFKAPEAA